MTEYSCNERATECLACVCTSPAHIVTVELDMSGREDHEDPEISLAIQLSPYLPWYKRVYQAVRYVFGVKDAMWSGHWDVCILDKRSVEKLTSMLTAWTIVYKLRARQRKVKGITGYT